MSMPAGGGYFEGGWDPGRRACATKARPLPARGRGPAECLAADIAADACDGFPRGARGGLPGKATSWDAVTGRVSSAPESPAQRARPTHGGERRIDGHRPHDATSSTTPFPWWRSGDQAASGQEAETEIPPPNNTSPRPNGLEKYSL